MFFEESSFCSDRKSKFLVHSLRNICDEIPMVYNNVNEGQRIKTVIVRTRAVHSGATISIP